MNSFFSKLLGSQKKSTQVPATYGVSLDYDKLIHLDAESLAEQGIQAAYEKLIPELKKYLDHPDEIKEVVDPDIPSYSVSLNGTEYLIYSDAIEGTVINSWPRAAYALFAIVNEQLTKTSVRFYAINGGNDLGGMFLTPAHALSAQAGISRKSDWPYIPDFNGPHFGQHH